MKKLLLALMVATSVSAQSAVEVQKLLSAEGAKLRALGSDPVIVAAVKAQNADKVPLAAIKVIDQRWSLGKESVRVRQTTTGACADRLRQIVAANPAYSETFAMDDQGAIVCATARTTDYWQGDEAKWQKTFAAGAEAVHVDELRRDESTHLAQRQVSLTVVDPADGAPIGAITVAVNADRME